MKTTLARCLLSPLLACYVLATAQEAGPWRAVSGTAQSITGDVALSDAKIAINFSAFTIARIHDLGPAEVSAVFDADSNGGERGTLYRLSIPGTKKFLHHTALCGSEDTQWMATYVEGRSLHLAFFSGQKMPVFSADAIANSTDLCGIFMYGR